MARLRAKYTKGPRGGRRLQTYQAEFYDTRRHPRRKRVTLRTRDQKAAELMLAQMEREYAMGLRDPWTDGAREEGVTVAEAIRRFIKSRVKNELAASSIATYEAVLTAFNKYLAPGLPLYGVESRQVTSFLNRRKLAEATRKGYAQRLNIFFSWCVQQGLIDRNPVTLPSTGKRARFSKLPEFLSEAEFEKLLATIRQDDEQEETPGRKWLLDVVRFAAGTGLRLAEICHLQWHAIDLAGGMLVVKNSETFQTKSGRERAVPLVGDAHAVVEALHARRPKAGNGYVFRSVAGNQLYGHFVSRVFREYRRKADLPEYISFHSLRHTFASWWVQRGGDLYRLKEVLGHADVKTTLKYAHLRPDALRAEMEKHFGQARNREEKQGAPLQSVLKAQEAELNLLRAELERLKRHHSGPDAGAGQASP